MGIEAASGLMSYGEIEARLDAASGPTPVAGILLDLDSPGGEASGVFELAERIRAASTIKPIWAHANDAAYRGFCHRGSLPAPDAVADRRRRVDWRDRATRRPVGEGCQDGLIYTAVFAGSHKNDFSPHEPLSPRHHALQTRWIASTRSS
jgi:ClpP class serine protease